MLELSFVELQLRHGSSRKPALDGGNRSGDLTVCEFIHQAWRARRMSNEQRDAAVVGELAYRLKRGVGTTSQKRSAISHAIRVELITAIQQLEGLPGASCAGAQHRVDQDALLSEVSAYLLRIRSPSAMSRRSLSLVNRCLSLPEPETADLLVLSADPDRLLMAGCKTALRDLARRSDRRRRRRSAARPG